MGYSISYTASGDKINFIDLKEKLTDKELDEIIQMGVFDRIQTNDIPSRETLIALNDNYFSRFPETGFRLYSYSKKSLDLSFLKYLSNLEKLSIDYTENTDNISSLSYLKNLKSLRLNIYLLDNFSFITELSDKLEQFSLETKKNSFDISLLNRFKQLKILYLSGCKKNIESVENLPLLESLLLKGITLKSAAFLNNIKALKSLKIHWGNTENFSDLYGNTSINALQIFRITKFTDIKLLANLPNLIAAELSCLRHIDHIPDLSAHGNLKHILFDDMKSLNDLSQLEYVKNLESVSFSCCPSKFEPENILPVLRNKSIKQCSFYTRSAKKNKLISEYIKEYKKSDSSNFMTVRNFLYSNCKEF